MEIENALPPFDREKEKITSIYIFIFFNRYVGNCTKKRLKHMCFPVKFAKLLRIPILKNICKRLLFDTIELSEEHGRKLKLNTEIDSLIETCKHRKVKK